MLLWLDKGALSEDVDCSGDETVSMSSEAKRAESSKMTACSGSGSQVSRLRAGSPVGPLTLWSS